MYKHTIICKKGERKKIYILLFYICTNCMKWKTKLIRMDTFWETGKWEDRAQNGRKMISSVDENWYILV